VIVIYILKCSTKNERGFDKILLIQFEGELCLQIQGPNGLVLISSSSSVSIVIVLSMKLPVFSLFFATKAINSLWMSTLLMINDEILGGYYN
jgi:hypothetical protein